MDYRRYRPKQYRKKFENNPDVAITHTSYALYFIVTWSVKQRFRLINQAIRKEIICLIKEKAKELGVHLLAIGVNPDHVHAVMSLKPVHYIPEILKELKGYTSYSINQNEDHFVQWTRGYDVRTISREHLSVAINYVKSQVKRHKGDYAD